MPDVGDLMALLTSYGSPDFRAAGEAEIVRAGTATLAAMTEAVAGFKEAMRDDVVGAGLGPRLANAWRSKVYPGSGRSLDPAGIVYVNPGRGRTGKAPDIMSFYAAGGVIRPLGRRFLAIPTEHVPRSRQGKPMSVAEVEARFGRQLVFIDPGDRGFHTASIRRNGVAFLVLKQLRFSRSGGVRNASRRELERGKETSAVIMFILVPQVVGRKRISPDEVFRAWAAKYPTILESHFELRS